MTAAHPTPPVDRDVAKEVDFYLSDTLVDEGADLVATRESPASHEMPNIAVATNFGAFLKLLTQTAGARRVLEFGTLAGYSTQWFAEAVGSQGQVVTLELEPRHAEVARKNFEQAGLADRVEVLVGPAIESAQRLIDEGVEPFDVVFIDADKPSNPAYLAAALELTRPGAVILIDNVVRGGEVRHAASADPSVQGVQRVLADIAANPNLEATALQTVGAKGWDGFIYARRR